MNIEKTDYLVNHAGRGPTVSGSADVQTFIRDIKIAYEKGALFFLALRLAPLLEAYYEKNETITPVELEALIAHAAKAMVNQ
ncbi:MAG: hypothetical protein HYR94_09265 [Chloroflexi bacterium]|nr:hypothetical protein [Chloroflexota bacterium]